MLHRTASRSLTDVDPLAVYAYCVGLLPEVQRIAIQTLKQATAHTTKDVVCRQSTPFQLDIEASKGFQSQPITLNDPYTRRENFEAFAIHFVAETFHQPLSRFRRHLLRIPGVSTRTDQAWKVLNHFFQLFAQDIA